jgi:hypothetical protein
VNIIFNSALKRLDCFGQLSLNCTEEVSVHSQDGSLFPVGTYTLLLKYKNQVFASDSFVNVVEGDELPFDIDLYSSAARLIFTNKGNPNKLTSQFQLTLDSNKFLSKGKVTVNYTPIDKDIFFSSSSSSSSSSSYIENWSSSSTSSSTSSSMSSLSTLSSDSSNSSTSSSYSSNSSSSKSSLSSDSSASSLSSPSSLSSASSDSSASTQSSSSSKSSISSDSSSSSSLSSASSASTQSSESSGGNSLSSLSSDSSQSSASSNSSSSNSSLSSNSSSYSSDSSSSLSTLSSASSLSSLSSLSSSSSSNSSSSSSSLDCELTYCLEANSFSPSGYTGNITKAGTYNGENYYTTTLTGKYFFWNGIRWVAADTVGGTEVISKIELGGCLDGDWSYLSTVCGTIYTGTCDENNSSSSTSSSMSSGSTQSSNSSSTSSLSSSSTSSSSYIDNWSTSSSESSSSENYSWSSSSSTESSSSSLSSISSVSSDSSSSNSSSSPSSISSYIENWSSSSSSSQWDDAPAQLVLSGERNETIDLISNPPPIWQGNNAMYEVTTISYDGSNWVTHWENQFEVTFANWIGSADLDGYLGVYTPYDGMATTNVTVALPA